MINGLSASRILLACAACAISWAQTPKPPFTAKDAERGLALANVQWKVRTEINDLTMPDGSWGFQAKLEPFKMIGNLYSVGVGNGDSYLLTSPQGHILFGAGFNETAEHVVASIQKL